MVLRSWCLQMVIKGKPETRRGKKSSRDAGLKPGATKANSRSGQGQKRKRDPSTAVGMTSGGVRKRQKKGTIYRAPTRAQRGMAVPQ